MTKEAMPVFKSSSTLANMKKDTFVVPQATTFEICQNFLLTEEVQKQTTNKLVDRTPHWLDLSDKEQVEEIKAALVLQTVAEYLYKEEYISDKCTMFENGFDKDGNVVLDAFYVKDNEMQRNLKKEFENKRVEKKAPVLSFSDFKKRKQGDSK